MGKRSKITQLPPEVKDWLDQALVAGNFAGYQQLAAELQSRGYGIGKSSIHRYGTNLERKLAAIKASTEAARVIAEAAPDDAGQLSGAVMGMIQTEVFNVLVNLQELEQSGEGSDEKSKMARAKLLSQLAKNVATLSRASVSQKKHEIEIRGKAKAAADAVAKVALKGGLSANAINNIRARILGIAT